MSYQLGVDHLRHYNNEMLEILCDPFSREIKDARGTHDERSSGISFDHVVSGIRECAYT